MSEEAAAFLASLIGRWPAPAPARLITRPGSDPNNAVVTAFDLPPLGGGTLDGETLAVKDNIAVAGVPMALGTGLEGFVPGADATLVGRARRAGARVIAKAQCEFLLLGANSFSSRPAPVRNPLAPAHSAGGSSSGAAAMVGAGLATMALGTDSGGSIRIPAANCGLVGFKPSRGRVPYTGIAPLEPFLEQAGPIGRTVADVAVLFAAIEGPDGRDPRTAWCVSDPGPERREGACRLGILQPAFDAVDKAPGQVLHTALRRLAGVGAHLAPLDWPGLAEARELHLAIYVAGQALIACDHGALPTLAPALPDGWVAWRNAIDPSLLPEPLREALAAGAALVAADPELYPRAVTRALALADELDRTLQDWDALLLPVTRELPPRIPDGEATAAEIYGDTALTAPFNVTGSPAVVVPAGNAAGLPVGLQLVGRRGADAALLAIAARVHAALAGTEEETTA